MLFGPKASEDRRQHDLLQAIVGVLGGDILDYDMAEGRGHVERKNGVETRSRADLKLAQLREEYSRTRRKLREAEEPVVRHLLSYSLVITQLEPDSLSMIKAESSPWIAAVDHLHGSLHVSSINCIRNVAEIAYLIFSLFFAGKQRKKAQERRHRRQSTPEGVRTCMEKGLVQSRKSGKSLLVVVLWILLRGEVIDDDARKFLIVQDLMSRIVRHGSYHKYELN